MENKFEMGPVQKLWIKQLREYPERQTTGMLGYGTPEDYKACCLGELALCYARIHNLELPFVVWKIKDIDEDGDRFANVNVLSNNWEKYGLKGQGGQIYDVDFDNHIKSLASMNDGGKTWTEIANFIESDPENVFTKSV